MSDAGAEPGGSARSGTPDETEGGPLGGIGLAAYRLTAAAGLALGAWVCWYAIRLTYYTPLGPGPGFFPFWLGLMLGLACAAVLGVSFLRRPISPYRSFLPRPASGRPMIATVAAIATFGLLVERLGFAITMAAVLLALLLAFGCRLFPTALLVALGGSFGIGFAFTRWLGVHLPPAPSGLFRAIGL
jgi:putative tricarboxylic transport membrane protein